MEVCVDNLESAINAEKGGAIRLELCSALSEGGLTPSVGFLRIVKKIVKIPVFVMIRPRGGDFIYSDDEIGIMLEDLEALKDNGADGFVFGIIDKEGNVDVCKCRILLTLAGNYPVTFHRAFDKVKQPFECMEQIIALGFKRILTSGLRDKACQSTTLIKQLMEAAKGRIIIMPGSGVTKENLPYLLKATDAVEYHGSAKVPKDSYFVTDEQLVRDMVTIYSDILKEKIRSSAYKNILK